MPHTTALNSCTSCLNPHLEESCTRPTRAAGSTAARSTRGTMSRASCTRLSTCTSAASSTATSSPRTCSSRKRASSSSRTWASPSSWWARPSQRAARRTTSHLRSSSQRATPAPSTGGRSASSSSSCSQATRLSSRPPPCRSTRRSCVEWTGSFSRLRATATRSSWCAHCCRRTPASDCPSGREVSTTSRKTSGTGLLASIGTLCMRASCLPRTSRR
mmetsp:Transcript_114835/g.364979  ORF Transcript_114835/g.364979 Transcript_114835/m.364979 type:complete len:217 (+) Transcript_114835:1658-2308(+)